MSKEKQQIAFENWYKSRWPQPVNENEFIWAVRKNFLGIYVDQDVRLAWEAWQAARELPIC